MIPTHKSLLVNIFLTCRVSKSLAFCEFASIYFERSVIWVKSLTPMYAILTAKLKVPVSYTF